MDTGERERERSATAIPLEKTWRNARMTFSDRRIRRAMSRSLTGDVFTLKRSRAAKNNGDTHRRTKVSLSAIID